MSDWVTVYEFSLQDDLSAVAAFIRRHQLPMRISEERNHQCVATLAPQLVEPMRQLLQRWQAGEVALENISVHVYEQQPQGEQVAAADNPDSDPVQPADPADSPDPDEPVPAASTAGQVPHSVIPQWPLSQTPLCLLLVVLCFLGWFLQIMGWDSGLMIYPQVAGSVHGSDSSLNMHLAQGEYWRLWTPAIIHFSLPHALFNSLGVWIVGRSLEARAGTLLFGLLVLISAPVSNLAQYFWSPEVKFGGMSGVVYALVGAAIVIQRWQPGWREVPPSILWTMVVWLFLCAFGIIEYLLSVGIANAAHVGGFATGAVLALLFCLAGGGKHFAPEPPSRNSARETF
ncbi:rhomboid family intramembrane serine protease [Microbulbifer sp. SA54]|uniref:rhomboid family intramembrane serine protease n=1 Tax=Microbulbifer sp. SA54 TaxID=3401577 RepID=UPI003AB102A0